MRVAALLVVGVAAGCIHTRRAAPSLSDALRLETNIRAADVQPATKVRARFFLRNTAVVDVRLCEVDDGVTLIAISARGRFPLVGHGSGSDVAPKCYKLASGEAKEFNEEFAWSDSAGFEL